MKMTRYLIIPLLLFGSPENMSAQSKNPENAHNGSASSTKLYVITRSTEKFKIMGRDNPSVGLFTTSDRGTTWEHHGWHFTKCFSAVVSPKEKGRVIYLACGNGVQKTEDYGKSWAIVTGWQMTECLKVAVDPVNTNIVYAATAYGIFKSSDAGKTWHEKNQGFESTFTASILIDRTNPDHLFAATETGVYQSTNGAASWQLSGSGKLGIRTIIQSMHDEKTLFIGTEDDGVFVSKDSGKSWSARSNGLESKTVYALAQDPKNRNVLYAGTFKGGVFKSTDEGRSWKKKNQGLKRLDIHALIVDPADSNVVYCGTMGGGAFMSVDAGASWKFIGLATSQVWDFAIQQ